MSWERIDLSDQKYAEPSEAPVTCDLIYRRKRHSLSGPPEVLKTLTALIFGLEHQRAGHGNFAFIDFENGAASIRLLLHDLGASEEEIAAVYYVAPDEAPSEANIKAIKAAGVTLAIIDSAAGAYDASGFDDNSRADVEKFSGSWITPLWKLAIATILLDHVVKNAEARGSYAIGSERKLGTVDVALGFHSIKKLGRGGTGLIRIDTNKDRPGHLPRPHAAELELHSDPETHRITWTFRTPVEAGPERDTWRPDVLIGRVREYLARNTDPISRSALANAVKGKREYVLQAIDCLIEDGDLEPSGKKLVPVPRNVPGTFPLDEGNGKRSPFPSLQGERLGERLSGTTSDPLEDLLERHSDIAEGTA
jgi:hypothetical protein